MLSVLGLYLIDTGAQDGRWTADSKTSVQEHYREDRGLTGQTLMTYDHLYST